MAELGSIGFNAPIDGNKDPETLAAERRTLESLASQVSDARVENRKGKAREEFQEAVEGIGPEADPTAVLPVPVGDPVLDEMRNTMVRLRFASEQGDSSLQARVELEAKRRLNALQAQHPRLRDELQNEFAKFVQTDAGFDELGLRDISRKRSSALAAADLKEIEDYAWEKLGMSPLEHRPESEIFAEEYQYRSGLLQKTKIAALQSGARAANASQSAAQKVAGWKSDLVGARTLVYASIADTIAATAQVKKDLLSDTAAATQRLADWNAVGKQQALQNVQTQIAILERDFLDEVDPFEMASDEFQVIEKMKTDTVEHLNRLVEAIQLDAPDAMEKWKTEQTIRQAVLREQNPDLDGALLFIETASSLFEPGVWETIGGEDTILQNEIGVRVQQSVADYLSRGWLNGGQGRHAGESPVEIRQRLRRNRSISETTYDTASTRDVPIMQAVVSDLRHQRSVLTGVAEHSDPSAVGYQIREVTNAFQTMGEQTGEPDVQAEADVEFEEFLASPGALDAVRKARESEAEHNSIVAMGDEAFEQWSRNGGHSAKRAALIERAQETIIRGTPATLFLEADLDTLEKDGTVRYVINEEAFAKFVPEPQRVATLGAGAGTDPGGLKPKLRQDLVTIANDLSREVTRDVRALALIDFSRNTQQADIDYGSAFANNAYQDVIPVPVAPEEL